MEILRTISLYADAKGIAFLLIGGHALNFYGLSRQTGDIDLVVRHVDKEWWCELLLKLRYRAGQNDDRFARFQPAELGEWPIDLMYVNDDTFHKLTNESQTGRVAVAEVRIVSPRHLTTMKLHALKYYQAHRHAKDYNDLLWLLRSGKSGLNEEDLHELCLKYAGEKLYKNLERDWKQ